MGFNHAPIVLAVIVGTIVSQFHASPAQAFGKCSRFSFPRGYPKDFSCHFIGGKKFFVDCDVEVKLGHFAGHEWPEQWPHYLAISCNGRSIYGGAVELLLPHEAPGQRGDQNDPSQQAPPEGQSYILIGLSYPFPKMRIASLPRGRQGGAAPDYRPFPGDDGTVSGWMAYDREELRGFCY